MTLTVNEGYFEHFKDIFLLSLPDIYFFFTYLLVFPVSEGKH